MKRKMCCWQHNQVCSQLAQLPYQNWKFWRLWWLVLSSRFLFPSHIRKSFGGYYANKNQSVGHEDGKVEFIRGGSNSPFQSGYS
jgi:hypothetical protein